MTKKKPASKAAKLDYGYINIRISRKAHRALLRKALADGRTLIATIERLIGV